MSSAQTTNGLNDSTTPNIYLNSDVIGKVCLLSAEKAKKPVPPSNNVNDDITSIPDDIIHCSLPNLSPVHGNQFNIHRKHCHQHHPPCNRHTICYSNVSMVHGGNNGTSHSISAYCSPRAGRKHRPGSYSTKDLSSLRAECYLKCKQQKGSRNRLDSGDSIDSDHGTLDSASHISTCATSDYAYMTSFDTIAMLCKECQKCHTTYNQDTLTPALSELDLCTTLRRTHSNPENCKLTDDNGDVINADDQLLIRDARSCSELNVNDASPQISLQQQQQETQQQGRLNSQIQSDGNRVLHDKTGRSGSIAKSMQNKDCSRELRRLDSNKKHNKSIAISEENLVSRVSRWLSTVDNAEILESDVF